MSDAQSSASSKKEAYAIYFCAEDSAKVAGEGTAVITKYKADNSGKCPQLSVFDSPTVPAELKKAGIKTFVKVAATKENQDLFKKYNAGLNTLVVCAHDGTALKSFAGTECSQANITSFCKSFPAAYAAYLAKAPKSGGG